MGELTIFRQKVVRPAYDERHDKRCELLELLLAASLHVVTSVRIATPNDSVFKVLAEVALRAKVVRIGKVKEREVF